MKLLMSVIKVTQLFFQIVLREIEVNKLTLNETLKSECSQW